ncbi:MAG: hypothetical protein PHN51_00135 [Candidatus Nanopelagicales bacterium]|nr:hypothetical protein [Candidatus Nanopelagicales bacterium]
MTIEEIEWNAKVEGAMIEGDAAQLLHLYELGTKLFGSELGVRWAAAVSGFDASAVTG